MWKILCTLHGRCNRFFPAEEDKKTQEFSAHLLAYLSPRHSREGTVLTLATSPYRLIFVDRILHAAAALRDPGGVKHWHRWHPQHRRRQSKVYTWRRDLSKTTEDILLQQTIINVSTAV